MQNYTQFLDKVFEKLELIGILEEDLILDHVAYRFETEEEYQKAKSEILEESKEIDGEFVSKWKVGIFELEKPWEYKNLEFRSVELLTPVEGRVCDTGLDHVEFVLKDHNFESFMKKYSGINWSTKSMTHPKFPKLKIENFPEIKLQEKGILEIY